MWVQAGQREGRDQPLSGDKSILQPTYLLLLHNMYYVFCIALYYLPAITRYYILRIMYFYVLPDLLLLPTLPECQIPQIAVNRACCTQKWTHGLNQTRVDFVYTCRPVQNYCFGVYRLPMAIVDGRLFVCRLFVVILSKYFMLTELYHGTNIAVKSVFVVVQNLLHHKDFELFACVLEVCKYRAYLF